MHCTESGSTVRRLDWQRFCHNVRGSCGHKPVATRYVLRAQGCGGAWAAAGREPFASSATTTNRERGPRQGGPHANAALVAQAHQVAETSFRANTERIDYIIGACIRGIQPQEPSPESSQKALAEHLHKGVLAHF